MKFCAQLTTVIFLAGAEPFAWFNDVLSRILADSIARLNRIASSQLASGDFPAEA